MICINLNRTAAKQYKAWTMCKSWECTPDSKVHGANMGPIRGRQGPGGLHVRPWTLLSGTVLRFTTRSILEDPEYKCWQARNLWNCFTLLGIPCATYFTIWPVHYSGVVGASTLTNHRQLNCSSLFRLATQTMSTWSKLRITISISDRNTAFIRTCSAEIVSV